MLNGITKTTRSALIGGGLVLVALLVIGLLPWYAPDQPVETPLFYSVSDPGKLPAELSAWLPKNRLEPEELVSLRLDVRNALPRAAVALRVVQLETPGFARTGRCWIDGNAACSAGRDPATERFELEPGESRRIEIELASTRKSGSFHLLSLLSVTKGRRALGTYSLTLGPVEVSSRWYRALRRFLTRLYAAAKDLAIPLALVVVGAMAGYFVREREESRRREAKVQQDEIAQARSTWTKLLERSLTDSQKYYMPLKSKARALLQAMKTGSDAAELCFRLLVFFRTLLHVQQEIGGFHFKSRLGESVVQKALGLLFYLSRSRIGEEAWADGLDHAPLNESYAAFTRRLQGTAPQSVEEGSATDGATSQEKKRVLEEWVRQIEAWVEGDPRPMADWKGLLILSLETIGYEANRPLEYWYREKPEELQRRRMLMVESCRAAAASLPESAGRFDRTLGELRTDLDLYLRAFEDDLGISHGAKSSNLSGSRSTT